MQLGLLDEAKSIDRLLEKNQKIYNFKESVIIDAIGESKETKNSVWEKDA